MSIMVMYSILGTVNFPKKMSQQSEIIGQQSAFPQHFVQVSLLQAGVAVSPSVVPLLAGYEHEQPVEHVPLPPETLIHFDRSAYQRHVHEPVQGCSVVVVVVVDDVVVPVLVVVVVVGGAVVVVLVVVVVEVVLVVVVVGDDWQNENASWLGYSPGSDGGYPQ